MVLCPTRYPSPGILRRLSNLISHIAGSQRTHIASLKSQHDNNGQAVYGKVSSIELMANVSVLF